VDTLRSERKSKYIYTEDRIFQKNISINILTPMDIRSLEGMVGENHSMTERDRPFRKEVFSESGYGTEHFLRK
jgi:hypothetical protein